MSGTGFPNSEQAGGTNSRWLSLSPQQFNRSGLGNADVLRAIPSTSPAGLQGERAARLRAQPLCGRARAASTRAARHLHAQTSELEQSKTDPISPEKHPEKESCGTGSQRRACCRRTPL